MKIETVSFNDEKEYIIHKRNLNEALNQGLVLHRKCIESKSWSKSRYEYRAKKKKKQNNDFKKYFFKLMNNAVFRKTMENFENTQRCNDCNNKHKKDLFSVRNELPYKKIFFIKFISHRNEENSNTYE